MTLITRFDSLPYVGYGVDKPVAKLISITPRLDVRLIDFLVTGSIVYVPDPRSSDDVLLKVAIWPSFGDEEPRWCFTTLDSRSAAMLQAYGRIERDGNNRNPTGLYGRFVKHLRCPEWMSGENGQGHAVLTRAVLIKTLEQRSFTID